MNNGIIATNLELVTSTFAGTESSIDEMIKACEKLVNTIEATTDWQGSDADTYKNSLLNFALQLKNCASWMSDAARQSIDHSKALVERATLDAQISIFD